MTAILFMICFVSTGSVFLFVIFSRNINWAAHWPCVLPFPIFFLLVALLALRGLFAVRWPLRFPKIYWMGIACVLIVFWGLLFGGTLVDRCLNSDTTYTLIQKPWLAHEVYTQLFQGMLSSKEHLESTAYLIFAILFPASAFAAIKHMFTLPPSK